jgi:hypothetical protein
VFGDPLAQGGQHVGEFKDAIELLEVALASPFIVIAVLTTSRIIGAHGLNVAGIKGADPHVTPRRRNDQKIDTGKHLSIGDPLATGVDVFEFLSPTPPGDSGSAEVGASKTHQRLALVGDDVHR